MTYNFDALAAQRIDALMRSCAADLRQFLGAAATSATGAGPLTRSVRRGKWPPEASGRDDRIQGPEARD